MAKELVAMLLAGGQGSRLYALTQKLAKPAVPFGGKYRIIDFPLSNCVNSGIDTVGILTQYQPFVLNEYIGNGQPWDLDRLYGGVHVLPPYQKASGSDWYKGTANAIYQNIAFIERYDPQYVIILSGDQICKQDYSDFLEFHKQKGAEFSVAVMEVPWEDASRFGLMVADEDDKITEFQEKPKEPKSNLASMGIYIFNWDILKKYLIEDEADPTSENDFGNNIIPNLLRDGRKMYAYIPKESKQIINDILRELEKDENIAQLYEQWYLYKQQVNETYNDTVLERLPLLEQKEFKSIKNMILNMVMQDIEDIHNFGNSELDDVTNETGMEFNEENSLLEEYKIRRDYKKIGDINLAIKNNEFEMIPESIEWLEKCELPLAKYILGKIYHDGFYVDRDLDKAIECYKQSGNNKFAYNRLANIYRELGDNDLYVHYLYQSADENFSVAQFKIGKILVEGEVTEKNVEQGIYYLNKACEYRNEYAQYYLGKMYLLGKDVEKDKERAIELLTLAAENGNEYAQYFLDHIDDIKEVPLSMMTTRMFRHIGRIIENELPIRNTILTGVEHKLKQKLIRKRSATGHREDDHSLRF